MTGIIDIHTQLHPESMMDQGIGTRAGDAGGGLSTGNALYHKPRPTIPEGGCRPRYMSWLKGCQRRQAGSRRILRQVWDQETYFHEGLWKTKKQGKALTLENTRYVLVEV